MSATTRSRGKSMRKKASNADVRKVFKDLGIDPADPRTGDFQMPMSPWPSSAAPVVYRTTLSNGTGKVARFDAELE